MHMLLYTYVCVYAYVHEDLHHRSPAIRYMMPLAYGPYPEPILLTWDPEGCVNLRCEVWAPNVWALAFSKGVLPTLEGTCRLFSTYIRILGFKGPY